MHEPGSNRARYVENKVRVNKETPYEDFEKVGHVDLELGHGDLIKLFRRKWSETSKNVE